MTRPTVSIVMPCYNCAYTVAMSIHSVIRQDFKDFELLIVNDGSADTSAAHISAISDPRIRLIQQNNAGVSAARNAGIQLSTGRYLAFLDADDTWKSTFLGHMLEALEARPDAVLAYCGWQNLELTEKLGTPFIPPDYETPDKLETLFSGCRWPIHAALVQREAVIDRGGFDVSLKNAEDYALWLAVSAIKPIVRVPHVLAYYHSGAGPRASANRLRAAMHHLEAQTSFMNSYPDLAKQLGVRHARQLMYSELLHKGYKFYWNRELPAARAIFRRVLAAGQGKPKDMKYLLSSLLPLYLHQWLVNTVDTLDTDGHKARHN